MNSAIVRALICELTRRPAGLLAIAVIGVKSVAMSNEAVLFCTRSMVCDSDSTTPIVWPSGAARLRLVMPSAPEAPAWFSTTTGWRNTSLSLWLTRRAPISPAPPGGFGTMILMAREGKSCARTRAAAPSMLSARTSVRMKAPLTARSRPVSLHPCRKVLAQPIAHNAPHPGVVLPEQEVVDLAEQMQLGGLLGVLEQLDRLLGRGDGIVRRMDQEQRPRRDLADHVGCAELEHALRGLGRKHLDRVLGEIVPQVRRDRHDLIARHHQRLAGVGAVRAALLQHLGEPRPLLRALVLAAKLALTVTPA